MRLPHPGLTWQSSPPAKGGVASLALALLLGGLQAPGAAGPLPAHTLPSPATGLRLNPYQLRRATGVPPAPGSLAEAEDLAILRWLQRFRSPQVVASTWLLLDRDLNAFSSAVGAELTPLNPVLASGLQGFMAPVNDAYRTFKKEHRRVRPYLAHPGLHPCLPPEDTGSFPSGHAIWFRTTASLLSDLLPERQVRLEHVGRQGGGNRVLCGVHYPSDVDAGQRLGAEAARQIIASPQWRAFRNHPALQEELKRLRAIPEEALPPLVR